MSQQEPNPKNTQAAASPPPIFVGDPLDKAIIRQLARGNKIPYIFLFIALLGNLVQFLRNPETIIVRETADGQRVVVADNRGYKMSGDIQLRPDSPTDGDKIFLVNQFTRELFGLDPQARKNQLERAYSMMLEKFAARYFSEYKSSGQLDVQRDERWQARWETQKITVDRVDPYLIHVIGTQDITKNKGGRSDREIVQHSLDFKLVDDAPRADRNLRTGFLIAAFGGTELSRRQAEPVDSQQQLPN